MPDLNDLDYDALSAYMDDDLNAADRSALETRLAVNPNLRAELVALRQVKTALAALSDVPAPRDFRLTPSMLPAHPVPKRTRLPQRSLWGWAAAAVVLIVMGGILLNRPSEVAAPVQVAAVQTQSDPTLVVTTVTASPIALNTLSALVVPAVVMSTQADSMPMGGGFPQAALPTMTSQTETFPLDSAPVTGNAMSDAAPTEDESLLAQAAAPLMAEMAAMEESAEMDVPAEDTTASAMGSTSTTQRQSDIRAPGTQLGVWLATLTLILVAVLR